MSIEAILQRKAAQAESEARRLGRRIDPATGAISEVLSAPSPEPPRRWSARAKRTWKNSRRERP